MWDFIWRWETLWYLMLLLYVPSCIGLIVIVLLQKGKGVGFAGAFGLGSGADTMFGPRARKSLPARLTHVMAGIFMVLAFCMSLVAGKLGRGIAPEKMDVTTEAAPVTTGLEDLGLGTGEGTAESAEEAPAPGGAAATPVTIEIPAATPSVEPAVGTEPEASTAPEEGAIPAPETPVSDADASQP